MIALRANKMGLNSKIADALHCVQWSLHKVVLQRHALPMQPTPSIALKTEVFLRVFEVIHSFLVFPPLTGLLEQTSSSGLHSVSLPLSKRPHLVHS